VPDPGNLLQADVPMEEEEEGGEQGEHHPHHQNGVRHHNGDVIGQASHVCRQMVLDGTCSKRLDTGYGTGMDVVCDLKWNRMQMEREGKWNRRKMVLWDGKWNGTENCT
jgi:hypothetical protein